MKYNLIKIRRRHRGGSTNCDQTKESESNNYNHSRVPVKETNQTFKRVMIEAGLYLNDSGI